MLEDYYQFKTYVRGLLSAKTWGLLSVEAYVRGLLSVKTYVRGLLSVKHILEDYYR